MTAFPTDEALVAALRRGELEAFDPLYARHADRLYGYLLRLTGGDAGRAEDLLHDVFLTVLEDGSFDPQRGRFAAWLYTVARNRAFEGRRRRLRRLALLARGRGPEPEATAPDEALDRQRMVHGAMAELSEAQRQALLLKQVGGLTYAEISELLGVAEGTIKSRVHKAVRSFRAQVARLAGAPDEAERSEG